MAHSRSGVLPRQSLQQLCEAGYITGFETEKFLNPASIDLPLSDEAYRLAGVFHPNRLVAIRSILEGFKSRGMAYPYDLTNPLEVGVTYLIRVDGQYELPPSVYGYTNPKSSVGRINLLCRLVADKAKMYDQVPQGWRGEMWVLATPQSFPVRLAPGLAVLQLRIFDGKTFLDPLALSLAIKQHGLFFHPDRSRFAQDEIEIQEHADSLLLTLDVNDKMMGWECAGTGGSILDYGKTKVHRPEDFFFQPVHATNGLIRLNKGSFYILTTYEHVVVPPSLSAELRAIDPRFGEFRVHAAGYIDPGWGWGLDGDCHGRPITLEITPFETAYFAHREVVARIRYEHMKEAPDVPYDAAASNYTTQRAAQLSKHFIVP